MLRTFKMGAVPPLVFILLEMRMDAPGSMPYAGVEAWAVPAIALLTIAFIPDAAKPTTRRCPFHFRVVDAIGCVLALAAPPAGKEHRRRVDLDLTQSGRCRDKSLRDPHEKHSSEDPDDTYCESGDCDMTRRSRLSKRLSGGLPPGVDCLAGSKHRGSRASIFDVNRVVR